MSVETQQFTGTDQYIATDSLKLAVKAARSLQKPLLVKGEPGTGKTLLAEQVAELRLKIIDLAHQVNHKSPARFI